MLTSSNHPVIAVVCSGIVSASCARSLGPEEFVAASADAAGVFQAAVAGLHEQLEFRGFIDPHPVRIVADVKYPQPSDYYADAHSETAARIAVLERLRIDTTTSFPLIKDCGPLMAPPGSKVTHGCPDARAEAAFDRIRRESNRWVIRTMWIDYDRAGRSASISDLTIARRNGRYIFEGERVLVQID